MTVVRYLDPDVLRARPQLASLQLLGEALEVSVIALCSEHPAIESATDKLVPIDVLADRIVERGMALLDSVHQNCALLRDLDRLGTVLDDTS